MGLGKTIWLILFCFALLLGAGLNGYGQRHCVLYVNDYFGKPIPNVHFYQEGTNIDTTFNTGRITFIIPNDFESGYRKIFAPFYKEANRLGYKYSDKDSVQFIVLENKDFLYELHNDTITTIPRPFGIKSPWNMHAYGNYPIGRKGNNDIVWCTGYIYGVYTIYDNLRHFENTNYFDSSLFLIACNKNIIRQLPEIEIKEIVPPWSEKEKITVRSLEYSVNGNINIPCADNFLHVHCEINYSVLEDLYESLIVQGYDSDKILFVSATDMTYNTICYVKPQIHVVLKQGYDEEDLSKMGIKPSCIEHQIDGNYIIELKEDDLLKGFDFWLKKFISCQLFSTVELVKHK